jgi:uncharacterized protein
MELAVGLPNFEQVRRYVLRRLEEELPDNLLYHGIHHTRDDVLPVTERLAAMVGLDGEDLLLLRTAALYHDIGYLERYSNNEPIGARIAAETLPDFGYSSDQIRVIEKIILATQMPQTPNDFLQELMCDADLDSLGREDYLETSHDLRLELAANGVHTTLEEWYRNQLKFLTEHAYFTQVARSLREEGKQRNIAELRRRLENLEGEGR